MASKKSPAKKAPVKKAVVKKAPAKKVAVKKTPAKKAPVKKVAAKKPAIKKQAAVKLKAKPKDQAIEVARRLAIGYPEVICDLDHRNAYELISATILSAQCLSLIHI